MKKLTFTLISLIATMSLQAQTETELNAWNDVNIYEINRLYPRTNVIPGEMEFAKLLNGDWKFQWVDSPSKAPARPGLPWSCPAA